MNYDAGEFQEKEVLVKQAYYSMFFKKIYLLLEVSTESPKYICSKLG